MIGPVFLKGDFIHKFKEHINQTEYHYVIHDGAADRNSIAKSFGFKEKDEAFRKFINADYPIVCKSGSKSSIPFWDYHIAVNCSEVDKELAVTELWVREPKNINVTNAILMAFYVLINDKYKYERLVVPIEISEINSYEDIEVYCKNDRTFLTKKHTKV